MMFHRPETNGIAITPLRQGLRVLLLGLCLMSRPAFSGYRTAVEAKTLAEVNEPKAPSRGWMKAQVQALSSEDKLVGSAEDVSLRYGRSDRITLGPLEKVFVTLTASGGGAADIFAYTINGGRINGKITDTLHADSNGRIVLTFQAGRYTGNYPVVLRINGREELLDFWVEAALEPKEEQP